jgi:Ni/Co efflux regulator RcnB
MRPTQLIALAVWAALAAGPALAEKPDHAGGKNKDKSDKHEQKANKEYKKEHKQEYKAEQKAEKHAREARVGGYFVASDRDHVHRYYASSGGGKGCPPGLAKKNNGCMPPGQAKKMWTVGQPLPREVVIYSVPQPILVTLPPPPPQHRYVRVAGDILLIAIGTSMVVDGINGLMN